MPSFVDLNNRGTNDMVVVQQNNNGVPAKVHILKNMHSTDLTQGLCKPNKGKIDFPYPAFDDEKSGDYKLTYN